MRGIKLFGSIAITRLSGKQFESFIFRIRARTNEIFIL